MIKVTIWFEHENTLYKLQDEICNILQCKNEVVCDTAIHLPTGRQLLYMTFTTNLSNNDTGKIIESNHIFDNIFSYDICE